MIFANKISIIILINNVQSQMSAQYHTLPTKQPIDSSSINGMITLLKEYQQKCLEKQDFASAHEAKMKIYFLKSRQIILKQEQLQIEDKQNVSIISKQGEQQIRMFQQHWDRHLQELIENLKQVEKKLEEQHEKQLTEFVLKLSQQEPPKMKYSTTVLSLRIHLRNLIKTKNYKQAQTVKIKLENLQKEEAVKWLQKVEIKKKIRLQAVKKKQQTQLGALRIKAEAFFNQSIKQRDQKFEILLKKNRKRKIESGKVPRQRLKAKTVLLNESKSLLAVNPQ